MAAGMGESGLWEVNKWCFRGINYVVIVKLEMLKCKEASLLARTNEQNGKRLVSSRSTIN